jgi:hypothetical protein
MHARSFERSFVAPLGSAQCGLGAQIKGEHKTRLEGCFCTGSCKRRVLTVAMCTCEDVTCCTYASEHQNLLLFSNSFQQSGICHIVYRVQHQHISCLNSCSHCPKQIQEALRPAGPLCTCYTTLSPAGWCTSSKPGLGTANAPGRDYHAHVQPAKSSRRMRPHGAGIRVAHAYSFSADMHP